MFGSAARSSRAGELAANFAEVERIYDKSGDNFAELFAECSALKGFPKAFRTRSPTSFTTAARADFTPRKKQNEYGRLAERLAAERSGRILDER